MAKKQKDDEVSRLEKQIRELKNLNRTLMKRLKKVDRMWQDLDLDEEFEDFTPPPKTVPKSCPQCGDAVCIIKVAGRSFEKCTNCKFRTQSDAVKKK
jgi:formamidopyrimidine-DNA glycosylase